MRRHAGMIVGRAALGLAFAAAAASAADAHAGESGLILLLPTGLYILGGGAAVLVSFLVLALFHRSPPAPPPERPRRILPHAIATGVSLLALLFLGLLVAAGFFGNPDPVVNPLPMTLWTLWWAGFTLLVALFGDLWTIANPWLGLYLLLGRRPLLAYPERLGMLPAILQFLGFAWFELVYPTPMDPTRLATAVTVYWLANFAALLLFGPRWLIRGEAFSAFFAMVGRLSARHWQLETDTARPAVSIGFGPPARMLRAEAQDLGAVAFVLVTLATVSFDGLSRTFRWVGALGLNPLEYPGRSAVILENTLGLLLCCAALGGLYAAAVYLGPYRLGGMPGFRRALCRFVLSIVPISIAYHVAHYLQALIVGFPAAVLALSDPFGRGWSLLPHAGLHHGSTMGLGTEGVVMAYRAETVLIVIGHVVATLVAHRIALEESAGGRRAMLGQIPLALLMVGYTVFGLWLLSTPEIG